MEALKNELETHIKNSPWLSSNKETAFSISSAKKMLKFLDKVPEKYKVGPWSPIAHIFILTYAIFLLFSLPFALEQRAAENFETNENSWLQTYRFIFGFYALSVTVGTIFLIGIWPMTSYTLTSWNFMTLRLLSAWLAGKGFKLFEPLAEALRFPALVGCTITVFVWWFVLVPLIDHLLHKEGKLHRQNFWKWNTSPALLNLHVLNLPLIAFEFLNSSNPLNFFDLWVGFFVAILYVLMYLNVLDPLGLHFYIVFTPRTSLCVISYGFVLLAYYNIFYFWNYIYNFYNV